MRTARRARREDSVTAKGVPRKRGGPRRGTQGAPMSIQWFPGHMTKARRELAEAIPKHDVVIEVLDARAPRASENPLVTELRGQKPCLKILSKADLADPTLTEAWLAYLERRHDPGSARGGAVLAIALGTDQPAVAKKRVPELCQKLAPNRINGKIVRAMIVGIPNVGKSTLINILVGRRVAAVGDEPAVTRAQQRVVGASGMSLSDTPGMMWPKIDDENASFRLALLGAIPDSALDYETVALVGARILASRYPERLRERYKLDAIPTEPAATLEAIGRRRGCLRSGGVVDMHKASDVLLHDLRQGALGRVTLESPPSFGAA